MQSGIRLPPYLEKEKGSVNVAWDELAKVLFQFSYVSGIMASDAFVEKRVANESVTEYFRASPAHAAQWARRMTTSDRSSPVMTRICPFTSRWPM